MGYWENLPKQDESGIWIEAGQMSAEYKWVFKAVGLIDAFLLCFTRKHGLQIWTLDKKLMSVMKVSEKFVPSE